MRVTDWLGDGGVWFHVNADHHVMALVDKGYAHFHHLAFEIVDIGQMRDCFDHLAQHGRWLGVGAGASRHRPATSRLRAHRRGGAASSSSTATWSSSRTTTSPREWPDDRYSSNTWGPLPPRSYFRFDAAAIESERAEPRDPRPSRSHPCEQLTAWRPPRRPDDPAPAPASSSSTGLARRRARGLAERREDHAPARASGARGRGASRSPASSTCSTSTPTRCSSPSPDDGALVNVTHLIPRSQEDLERRRARDRAHRLASPPG